jgi:deoxyribonuclease-4
MSKIKIGPSGLGPVKTAKKILEQYKSNGIGNCELAFTYSVYIKENEAKEIKKIAEELGIDLSIHAPYFVNLNSDDEKKLEATKQRILKCCERGHDLGAKNIVFHPGYYGSDFGKPKTSEEEKDIIRKRTYEKIKQGILEIMEEVKKNKWDVKLCPETMGKINVFGSPEEISKLVEETGCSFCIDFAHILAREKKVDYEKIKKLFPQKDWHVHFSGIVYGEKGEKHHINLEDKQWKELFDNLPDDKNISIVCESPDTIGDAIKGLGILESV